jgi:hypothetical protein
MTTTDTSLFKQIVAYALPDNLGCLEHVYDVPGPKVIIPVGSVTDAIQESRGRECYLYHSHIDGNLYLVIPVEITSVSLAHHGDVLEVSAAVPLGRE